MVLAGSRLPSKLMIDRLARRLLHTPAERRYLELLVEKANTARHGGDPVRLDKELAGLKPVPVERTVIDMADFSQIFHWYYFAIRQVVQIPGVDTSPESIYLLLKKKVPVEKIKEALIRLCYFGYLQKDIDGNYSVRQAAVMTPSDVPSSALRMHHAQMMKRATEALEEQPVEKREITSMTLRVRAKDMAEAKKRIRQFRDEFDSQFGKEDGESVYQLNVQFFAHTQEKE